MLCYNKKNPVELKHCETPSSYRVFYLIKLKPQKEREYLILEYDFVTRKPRIACVTGRRRGGKSSRIRSSSFPISLLFGRLPRWQRQTAGPRDRKGIYRGKILRPGNYATLKPVSKKPRTEKSDKQTADLMFRFIWSWQFGLHHSSPEEHAAH